MRFFKLKEFACPCCGVAEMDTELLLALDLLREAYAKPIYIASGYRCAAHNAKVSKSPSSMHVAGKAADIKVRHMSDDARLELISLIMEKFRGSFRGVGTGKFNLHVDVRDSVTTWRYDDLGNVIPGRK